MRKYEDKEHEVKTEEVMEERRRLRRREGSREGGVQVEQEKRKSRRGRDKE